MLKLIMLENNLSLIIITYNSRDVIVQCLLSVIRKTYEALVIDNVSIDDTSSIISNKFSRLKLIKNKKNLGFAVAANRGARIARGDYLLFLNPDTVVKEGCIEEMINFLKKKKDAAVVGCKVLNPDGTLQPSCGKFPTIINIILDRIPIINNLFGSELIRQEDFYKKQQTADWISGAFFMVRRDVFLRLGGFDKRYFMYVEDIDFCYRAWKAGYKIYYNPKAEIIHYDMGKSPSRKGSKAINMRKGFSIFFEKYKSPYYFFIWRMILRIDSIFKMK